jgi:hypothetical protein
MGFPPAGQKHQMALKCSTKRGQVRQVVPAARHKPLWRWELACGVVGRCLWRVGGGHQCFIHLSTCAEYELHTHLTPQLGVHKKLSSYPGLLGIRISEPRWSGPSSPNRAPQQAALRSKSSAVPLAPTPPTTTNIHIPAVKWAGPREQRRSDGSEVPSSLGPHECRDPTPARGRLRLRTARSAIPRPLFFVWVALLASLAKRAAVAA